MNKHARVGLAVISALTLSLVAGCASTPAKPKELRTVKVGICAGILSAANGTPFAAARKYGWFEEAGLKVEPVPLGGSSNCVKQVEAGQVDMAIASPEPVIIGKAAGVKSKIFYLVFRRNVYYVAVPADSPIKEIKDLKGKKVGVTTMDSGGVPVIKAIAKNAGLDPEKDITLLVVKEGPQTAQYIQTKQVDALIQFDSQYAMVDNAGVKLRQIPAGKADSYPSNGLIATPDWLAKNKDVAVAVARGYAMGTAFSVANPEAAVKLFWQFYPEQKPTGKDNAQALTDEVAVAKARYDKLALEPGAKWGEMPKAQFNDWLAYMQEQGNGKGVTFDDMVDQRLVDEINKGIDTKQIEEMAKNFKG